MNFVSHISRCDVLVAFGLMSAKQQTLLPLILANINFVTFAAFETLELRVGGTAHISLAWTL